jgi:hypothetical protein
MSVSFDNLFRSLCYGVYQHVNHRKITGHKEPYRILLALSKTNYDLCSEYVLALQHALDNGIAWQAQPVTPTPKIDADALTRALTTLDVDYGVILTLYPKPNPNDQYNYFGAVVRDQDQFYLDYDR